jgi:uncharacterized phage infection (PIP) family protein YhgE
MSDSGHSDELSSGLNVLEDECNQLKDHLGQLETLVEMNEDSLKLQSMLSSLNSYIENKIKEYESVIENDESTEENFEPELKRSRDKDSLEVSLLDKFMTRSVQRRAVGNHMTTLILKLSTISNLSSRQIFSTINFMQSEVKLWDPQLFATGMPSDRTIRSMAYRILGLHKFFVKQYLENSEYIYICTDGAS